MNITKAGTTRKVLLALIAFIVIVTVISAVLAFQYFKNQKITSLSQRVTSFAVALDVNEIRMLSGSETGLVRSGIFDFEAKIAGAAGI